MIHWRFCVVLVVLFGGCGDRTLNSSSDPTVSAGQISSSTHFSYRSSVGLSIGSRLCTGTLVSARTVLTAAHCFHGLELQGLPIFATFGLYHFSSSIWQKVSRVVIHSGYKPNGGLMFRVNDIAVLSLPETPPPPFSPVSVALPGEKVVSGAPLVAAGYGVTEVGDDEGTLRFVSLSYLHKPLGSYELVAEGARQGGVFGNTCSGDSGGPLFLVRQGGPILLGITARGLDCTRSGRGTYTDVRDYSQWISCARFVALGGTTTPGDGCVDLTVL